MIMDISGVTPHDTKDVLTIYLGMAHDAIPSLLNTGAEEPCAPLSQSGILSAFTRWLKLVGSASLSTSRRAGRRQRHTGDEGPRAWDAGGEAPSLTRRRPEPF